MKRFLYLIAIFFVMFGLVACGKTENKEDKEVTQFNDAISYNYSSYCVTVKTTKDNVLLKSVYDISKKGNGYEIKYSIQTINELNLDSESVPDEMISTKTGTYNKENTEFELAKFKFVKSSFTSYSFADGSLKANIDNARNYLKTNYDCNNFTITFNYHTILTGIEMQYYLSDSTLCQIVFSNFC